MLKDSSLGVQVNLRITDIKIIESPQVKIIADNFLHGTFNTPYIFFNFNSLKHLRALLQ